LKKIFATAHDITPEDHIRIQAMFQEYTDNAVSKTVNFKKSAVQEEIKQVYLLAYDLKCKGVTVYRDGSRDGQVLTVEREKKSSEVVLSCTECLTPRSRDDVIRGVTRKMVTGCGSLYVTLNEDDDGLFEAFAVMGKSGGCAASQTEAISRLISLCLRCGIHVDQIIKQLKGVRCPNQAWGKGGRIYSCADAIAKAMEQYNGIEHRSTTRAHNIEQAKQKAETNGKGSDSVMVGVCPECHGPLEFESGCSVCRSCGFSRCG
jgi:ribonucleoside-diphosphate reductase alpha chain